MLCVLNRCIIVMAWTVTAGTACRLTALVPVLFSPNLTPCHDCLELLQVISSKDSRKEEINNAIYRGDILCLFKNVELPQWLIKHRAVNTYEGVEVRFLTFLTSVLAAGNESFSLPCHFIPRYSLIRGLVTLRASWHAMVATYSPLFSTYLLHLFWYGIVSCEQKYMRFSGFLWLKKVHINMCPIWTVNGVMTTWNFE